MQSFRWYVGRFKAMSIAEIVWRLKSEVMSVEERLRVASHQYPGMSIDSNTLETGFSVSDMTVGEWRKSTVTSTESKWLAALIEKADKIIECKLSFFDLQDISIGNPIDWHYDHCSSITAPVIYSKKIDYRNVQTAGDCKLVWEPNRHHQFVVLGRAYRATGDEKYASALLKQLESWIDNNPFGKGMNWRSPLELGIRLINWVWALDLIADSRLYNEDIREKVLQVIYMHCWDIARKFSQGTSANNHLVGEAAGVYVATSYFPNMKNASKWRMQSKSILEQQIKLQTYPDGCTREQALGYEFFVIQFYVTCGLVGRWTNDEFTEGYWSIIENMYSFVASLSAGGNLPMFGDRDDGYVLDLGNIPDDVSANLSVASILFDRADFACQAGEYSETGRWLLGSSSQDKFNGLASSCEDLMLESRQFTDSGYHLLQYGKAGSGQEVSVMFDSGELGFGAIAAHGHADALSFVLRIGTNDILVDPGTYDYFTYPEWREYFRKTRAHNTIEVDGLDQSELLGPFLWGKRANSLCKQWLPAEAGGGVIEAEHDGYRRLKDPVMHSRHMELNADDGELVFIDRLSVNSSHKVSLNLHFSDKCRVSQEAANRYSISFADKLITLDIDAQLTVAEYSGSNDPIAGWFSPGYHQKVPVTTITASANIHSNSEFRCVISGLPQV